MIIKEEARGFYILARTVYSHPASVSARFMLEREAERLAADGVPWEEIAKAELLAKKENGFILKFN